jgi:hypothetical protein
VKGSCQHGNEPSSAITFWDVFEQLHMSAANPTSRISYKA